MKTLIKTTLAAFALATASSLISSCGGGEVGSRFFGNPKTQHTQTNEKKPADDRSANIQSSR